MGRDAREEIEKDSCGFGEMREKDGTRKTRGWHIGEATWRPQRNERLGTIERDVRGDGSETGAERLDFRRPKSGATSNLGAWGSWGCEAGQPAHCRGDAGVRAWRSQACGTDRPGGSALVETQG